MDSKPLKFYHIHDVDSRNYLESFFSDKVSMLFGDDCLTFPMTNLHYMFSRGFVAGKLLIDISIGAFIHHLYSASGYFDDIMILKFSEMCVMEVRRWLNNRTGAFDWTHTSSTATQLEGKSDTIQDKEMSLKKAIKQIVTCNNDKENITDPLVLPLADCLVSAWILDVISKDRGEYMRNMEKISKLLRIGGHLILIGASNTTYITISGERYHALTYNEDFVKNALKKVGFVIDYYAVKWRRTVSDLTDYNSMIFIVAHKEK